MLNLINYGVVWCSGICLLNDIQDGPQISFNKSYSALICYIVIVLMSLVKHGMNKDLTVFLLFQ